MKEEKMESEKFLRKIDAIIENADEGVIHYMGEDRILHVAVSKGERIDLVSIVSEKIDKGNKQKEVL